MPIRPAVPTDLPEIAALIRELAEYEEMSDEVVWDLPQLEAQLFGPEPAAHVLLAETDDGQVAGMALWFRTFSTVLGRSGIWLEDLYVRRVVRRGGFFVPSPLLSPNTTASNVPSTVTDSFPTMNSCPIHVSTLARHPAAAIVMSFPFQ